ncbi:MAG: hypothetical protein G01um101419_563 [Parcubacteria group bacterium Gr01-1014_19]|nr:MAG: hypothetical protein G01um101419_563 [Parcubacteria group bacterium Gr01-1014_19]
MKRILSAALFLALAPPVLAEESDLNYLPEHRFRIYYNFSNGKVHDPDSIAGWALSYSELLHVGADNFILGRHPEKQSPGERLLRFGGSALLLLALEIPAGFVTHEYGHFRMDSVAGMYKPIFGSDRDNDYAFVSTPFNAYLTAFETAATGGFNTYHASQQASELAELLKDPKRAPYALQFDVMIEAGGLNMSQYTAETFSQKILDGHGQCLDIVTYGCHALDTLTYINSGGGDISDYSDLMEKLGIKTSHSEIRIVSQVPKLIGNSTISLLIGMVDYIATGDRRIDPLGQEFGPVQVLWPEFASYLTLNGPTIKLIEQVNVGKQHFYLTAEKPLPKNMIEGGIGWRGDICKYFGAEVYAVHNFDTGGNWFEGGPVVRPCEWFAFGVKGYYGSGYTLRREIAGSVPDFMEEKEAGLKGFVEINLKF